MQDGLRDLGMVCPHHFRGVCPTCPVCCFPQPARASQPQSPCHKWQTCCCFRTGRHCIRSDRQQPAEATPGLIVVTPGEIGCQLGADGADEEIGPRCPAVEQQQPNTLQVLHFWDAREQLTVVRNGLRKFPFDEFLPPHRGAQDGDSLVLWSVILIASPNSGGGVHDSNCFFQDVAPVRDETTAIPRKCTATVRSGVDTTCKSSRNAKSRSPSSNLSEMATNAACCPKLNNMGISRSPCFPPSPWRM